MENRRAMIGALIAAAGGVLFFWIYVNQTVELQVGAFKEKKTILKAREDIPAGERIRPGMWQEDEWPVRYIPPEAATLITEVDGQVALATIKAGEPILKSKIIPFDESALERRIPEGYRVVTIGIRDDQDVPGVAGMIRPGNFVDILTTLFISTEEIEKNSSAAVIMAQRQLDLKAEVRTIFENIQVLAVGKDQRIRQATVNRSGPIDDDLANKNITVALKPADAQKMVLAQSIGRITLVLRRFNDTEISRLDYLDPFRGFGIKLPVVIGPTPAYREIRGGQVYATPY